MDHYLWLCSMSYLFPYYAAEYQQDQERFRHQHLYETQESCHVWT